VSRESSFQMVRFSGSGPALAAGPRSLPTTTLANPQLRPTGRIGGDLALGEPALETGHAETPKEDRLRKACLPYTKYGLLDGGVLRALTELLASLT
jgi:hypothetical protein